MMVAGPVIVTALLILIVPLPAPHVFLIMTVPPALTADWIEAPSELLFAQLTTVQYATAGESNDANKQSKQNARPRPTREIDERRKAAWGA
jgi:hypothetical protein